MANSLRAAILVISDTAFQDSSTDKSRETLSNVFREQGAQWSVTSTEIVPDKKDLIASQIEQWCGNNVNLIITTGGTGFATKDVTPEAVEPLLERKAPGLV
jgi:gephyrin